MFARGSGSYFAGLAVALLLAAVLAYRSPAWWAVALLVLLLAVLLLFLVFFRDPERAPAAGVVSPADGRVMFVDDVDDPDLGRSVRVAVFMHVYNVHVNRAPVAGEIAAAAHKPGGHVPAWNKESDRNERFTLLYAAEAPPGGSVRPGGAAGSAGTPRAKTVQIAGTVARRIVPYVNAGDRVAKGQRVGLIRFGSRVDTLVPASAGMAVAVRPGERVQAGVSTLFHERP